MGDPVYNLGVGQRIGGGHDSNSVYGLHLLGSSSIAARRVGSGGPWVSAARVAALAVEEYQQGHIADIFSFAVFTRNATWALLQGGTAAGQPAPWNPLQFTQCLYEYFTCDLVFRLVLPDFLACRGVQW